MTFKEELTPNVIHVIYNQMEEITRATIFTSKTPPRHTEHLQRERKKSKWKTLNPLKT
jgi:hypothetical protein